MAMIWLRYRDNTSHPPLQLRHGFGFDALAMVAEARRKMAKEQGQHITERAMAAFAQNIGRSVAREAPQNEVDDACINFIYTAYLWLTEFRDTPPENLKDGTIECIFDGRSSEVTVHLASPNDPLHPRLMCFSLEIDAFLTEQQTIQAAAVSMAGQQAIIVDDLVALYKELSSLSSSVVEIHPIFVAFVMTVQADIAAACSLTLSGRADTALAVARRALETAGFARVIADDKNAAQIWVFARDDDKSWRLFKEKFKIKHLYPRDGGFWQAVYDRYDTLSRMYHPGPDSFVRLEFNPLDNGKLRVATRQFEHGPEDSQTAIHNMWMILDVFALALAAFEASVRSRLASYPGYDLTRRITDIARSIQEYSPPELA